MIFNMAKSKESFETKTFCHGFEYKIKKRKRKKYAFIHVTCRSSVLEY